MQYKEFTITNHESNYESRIMIHELWIMNYEL